MKKVFLLTLLIAIVTSSFAQEILQIESCSVTSEQSLWGIDYHSTIIFSNGDKIMYDSYWWMYPQNGGICGRIDCNIDYRKKYPVGTLVYKYPSCDKLELIKMTKVGTYTIKKASVREINVELNANLDYGYRSFRRGILHLEAKGGTKTVVNIIFTNGQTASIIAADDPIWLEAEAEQQVEHYRVQNYNIYKLIF